MQHGAKEDEAVEVPWIEVEFQVGGKEAIQVRWRVVLSGSSGGGGRRSSKKGFDKLSFSERQE